MKKVRVAVALVGVFVVAACVTINVYFPAAAADRAAEEFVTDVLGEGDDQGWFERHEAMPIDAPLPLWASAAGHMLGLLVPSAQAQEPDIEVNTPQINEIKARMTQRQRQDLEPLFDAGAIGFTADGFVEVRDRSAVSLKERRNLESLVSDENRDRRAVYREIAVANGHPEWEDEVRQTFARQWVRNARKGWYYHDAQGNWVSK